MVSIRARAIVEKRQETCGVVGVRFMVVVAEVYGG
jgi:hypothetical protein